MSDQVGLQSWLNAIEGLCSVLEDFASPEFAEKLGAGLTRPIDSDELLAMFEDFYDVIGPTAEARFHKLPKELDAQLLWFHTAARTAIDTHAPHPTPERFEGERFLSIYGRLREGVPPDETDLGLPKLVSDAELVRSPAWKSLQSSAANLIQALQRAKVHLR